MAGRTGSAILPLHGGRVPGWLADRMTRLGAVMSQAIVHHQARVNLKTGLPATPGDPKAIMEAFKPTQEPLGAVAATLLALYQLR